MVETCEIRLHEDRYRKRSYVASLKGLDPKYEFSREFLDVASIPWRSKSGKTWESAYDVREGRIYESEEYGERRYFKVDPACKIVKLGKDDVIQELKILEQQRSEKVRKSHEEFLKRLKKHGIKK